MKVFFSLSAFMFLAGVATAAPSDPKGSVVCEVPDGATTALGSTYGSVRARVKSDTSLGRVKLDLTKNGAKDAILIERVASAAAKKYSPTNPKYENSNKFTLKEDNCVFQWLLPKNVSSRVNKFDGYLQQICFKDKKKLPLDTLTLTCRFVDEFTLDEDDKSPTAIHLTELTEQAQVANGSADVVKFSKETWSETRALRRLTYELPNEKQSTCKHANLPVDDVAGAIKAIGKSADDKEMQASIEKIRKEKNLFKILGRITVDGNSEACSHFNFHVYTNDGYMLDLDYDTGD